MNVIWNPRMAASAGLILGALLALPMGAAAQTPATERPVTFAKDIAPILQQNCQVCHRPGSMAPMSLLTY